MSIVELSDIGVVRSGNTILDGISWTIQEQEHWALLGANGSGKTTLLKVVTGYEWPTRGSVTVLGRQFGKCDLRALRKTIGWVSIAIETRLPVNDTTFEIALSGFEASLGVYQEVTAVQRERVAEVLELLALCSVQDHTFRTLSHGERQRTLIARALVNHPALLVLDEPCSGLDPAARVDFLEDLRALSKSSDAATMVMVTHHIEEIAPWITHVHVLKEGRTLGKGRVEDMLTSEMLSEMLAHPCSVQREGEVYSLRMNRVKP